MKVNEIIGQQLDEISLKHAAAVGIMGASMMGMPHKAHTPTFPPEPPRVQAATKPNLDAKLRDAIEIIATRYEADSDLVEKVFNLAKKYEKPEFPTARDILAIIAVESEFDPDAVSNLRHDPAVGLMQVRPKKWGLNAEDLRDPETAIKIGSEILNKYYKHLRGNKLAAVQAYNIGLENFRQGQEAPDYLNKFLSRLKNIPI